MKHLNDSYPLPNPSILSENQPFTQNDVEIKVFDFDPSSNDSTSILSEFFLARVQEAINSLFSAESLFTDIDRFTRVMTQQLPLREMLKLSATEQYLKFQIASVVKIAEGLYKNRILSEATLFFEPIIFLRTYISEYSSYSYMSEDFFKNMKKNKEKAFELLEKDETLLHEFLEILQKFQMIYFFWNRIKYKLFPKERSLLGIGEF